jgi:hypothetical protein
VHAVHDAFCAQRRSAAWNLSSITSGHLAASKISVGSVRPGHSSARSFLPAEQKLPPVSAERSHQTHALSAVHAVQLCGAHCSCTLTHLLESVRNGTGQPSDSMLLQVRVDSHQLQPLCEQTRHDWTSPIVAERTRAHEHRKREEAVVDLVDVVGDREARDRAANRLLDEDAEPVGARFEIGDVAVERGVEGDTRGG